MKIRRIGLTAAAVACVGCASNPVRPWEYEARPMADTLAILEPAERDVPLAYDAIHNDIFYPIGSAFSFGAPGDAWNVTDSDDVANSMWFTRRNSIDSPLAPDAVMNGAHKGTGPDQTAGPLKVSSMKSEGINVGFFAKDATGQRYLVKLDPPEYPEMASGADVLATNLVWSSGYNTPENYVFFLDPNKLTFSDDLKIVVDEDGETVTYAGKPGPGERPLTTDVFQRSQLAHYTPGPDGRIRAVASKFLPGIPKGPFSWTGVRPDDPNDVIPHEDRRELRAFYVIAAWLNSVDAKQGNTLDMFELDPRSPTDESAQRYGHLVHYMLDNGASLGSGGVHPHHPRQGSENDFDLSAIGHRFLSFGIYERPWQDVDDQSPENIGWYGIEGFEPGDWRPNMPNKTFDSATPADGYWGAKIVMAFSDAQLARAIDISQWSSPAVRAYILKGLKERRDATGRYWFAEVSPLENARVENATVSFEDYWTKVFGGGAAQYRWRLRWRAPDPDLEADGVVDAPRVELPLPAGAVAEAKKPEDRYARLEVWRSAPQGDGWAPRPVTMWLEWDPAARSYRLVGLRH